MDMMNVKVKVYNGVKYNANSEKVAEVEYDNIRCYEVVTGERATEIGLETDESSRDEYNEYLIITLENERHQHFVIVTLICLEFNNNRAGAVTPAETYTLYRKEVIYCQKTPTSAYA